MQLTPLLVLPLHCFCIAAGIVNEDDKLLLEDGLYGLVLHQQAPYCAASVLLQA